MDLNRKKKGDVVVPQELNAKKNPTNKAVNRLFVVLIALAPMTLNNETKAD